MGPLLSLGLPFTMGLLPLLAHLHAMVLLLVHHLMDHGLPLELGHPTLRFLLVGQPWHLLPRPSSSPRPPQALLTGSTFANTDSSCWFPNSGATHHVTNDVNVIG